MNCLHGLPARVCAICLGTVEDRSPDKVIGKARTVTAPHLGAGSREMISAASKGAALSKPLDRSLIGKDGFSTESPQTKAKITRSLGMGITIAMSGYQVRSQWGRQQQARDVIELLKNLREKEDEDENG